jgi:site-specific DNA-cytosine methylase
VAAHPQPYISLFTGAGGLDLAVRIALPSARAVCYVENDVAVARILAARIADGSLDAAPVWSDVRTFDGSAWRGRVAGIIGGFPCTDLSVAGKRAGITGERSGLWFEYLRIIREVQPRWVFIENVPAVIAFPAGGIVLGGLAENGFDAEWISVRASDVGAPHKRERVFILAYRRHGRVRLGPWETGGGRIANGHQSSLDIKAIAELWTTPQAHDSGGGDPKRIRRHGTKHGCANLADDVTMWTTPNVPNGGRTLPAETVENRGATAKGKRQVGLHNEAALWEPDSER